LTHYYQKFMDLNYLLVSN